MKAAAQPIESGRAEPDLVDRIAEALPAEVRADYYRELRHCRSLPENDEMLRILRAMQFLVLLIEQAPARVGAERERLEKMLTAVDENLQGMVAASHDYHADLDKRLIQLPAEVARGISPEAIAGTIHESLRQHFVRSTIPETAQALAVTSGQLKKVCLEFATSADGLGHAYRGAAEDARRAISSMRSEISDAAATVKREANELAATFHKAYRWSVHSVSGLTLLIGFALGMMFEYWIYTPREPVPQPAGPVIQTPPPHVGKTKK